MANQDPWAKYRPTQPVRASVPGNAASSTGPTELRFQQQDAKMSELEARIAEIHAAQQYQAKTSESLAKVIASTEARLQSSFQTAVEGVKNELTQAFTGALKHQSQQFDSKGRSTQ